MFDNFTKLDPTGRVLHAPNDPKGIVIVSVDGKPIMTIQDDVSRCLTVESHNRYLASDGEGNELGGITFGPRN